MLLKTTTVLNFSTCFGMAVWKYLASSLFSLLNYFSLSLSLSLLMTTNKEKTAALRFSTFKLPENEAKRELCCRQKFGSGGTT